MSNGVSLGVSGSGYPTVHVDGHAVYIHRLSAVAEHGVSAVADRDVHHVDGNSFNSARDNLEPVPPGMHRGWNLPGGPTPGASESNRA